MSLRYFRRRWEESRGDAFAEWGASTWYFEADDSGYVLRQVESYDGGAVLKYDETYLDDAYGGLADQSLDLAEYAEYEITLDEFESAWAQSALNRRPLAESPG